MAPALLCLCAAWIGLSCAASGGAATGESGPDIVLEDAENSSDASDGEVSMPGDAAVDAVQDVPEEGGDSNGSGGDVVEDASDAETPDGSDSGGALDAVSMDDGDVAANLPDGEMTETDTGGATSTSESVALGNPWGIHVNATLHAPLESVGSAAVLLIHQYNQSSAQWEPWLPGLLAHGWRVLTVDLPFHGDSDPIPDAVQSDLLDSPDLAPQVIVSALEWLGKSGGADPDRIAIVGTSIGANLACVFNANSNPLLVGAKLGVAISPRDTAVFQLAGNPKSISFTGMYFLASENDNDGVQAETCATFGGLTDPPVEIVIVPDSSAHGLFLLQEDPELWGGIDTFLGEHL